jgi:hypothetical protein
MTIESASHENGATQENVIRYALTEGVVRARKAANRNSSFLTISSFLFTLASIPAVFIFSYYIYSAPWREAAGWQSFESLITAIAIVAVVFVGGFFLLAHFANVVTNQRMKALLSDDSLIARVADDFGFPVDMVTEGFDMMLKSRGAVSEFAHGHTKIRLKIATQRDDVLGRDVSFLKVSKEKAVSVTDGLIVV